MQDKLETKLNNLDEKCFARKEYKIAVYSRYILPSMRYHLTVHNLHQTHLDILDMCAQKYLKKWLDIPTRGATSQEIFHQYLLGINPVSQVNLEGHARASRVKGSLLC